MDIDKRFKDMVLSELEIPQLTLKSCAHIELFANTQANIEGCKGIVEYTEEKIVLNLGSVCAKFCGKEMTIRSFDGESAVICGTFMTIEFC